MVYADETLIVIPARGGSKRLPRKNILPLAGKPMICWTIEAAISVRSNARILVTSDDDEILAIASRYERDGVILHKRPSELAADTSSTVDVLLDVLDVDMAGGYDAKKIVLLQPTSPLRTADDIKSAMALFSDRGSKDTVVTVCKVEHPTAWVGGIDNIGCFYGVDFSGKRSQDYQKEYRLNGAVYIFSVSHLIRSGSIFTERVFASIMPRNHSLDVDDVFDLKICEFFLEFNS